MMRMREGVQDGQAGKSGDPGHGAPSPAHVHERRAGVVLAAGAEQAEHGRLGLGRAGLGLARLVVAHAARERARHHAAHVRLRVGLGRRRRLRAAARGHRERVAVAREARGGGRGWSCGARSAQCGRGARGRAYPAVWVRSAGSTAACGPP
jgi:hypothetical protein